MAVRFKNYRRIRTWMGDSTDTKPAKALGVVDDAGARDGDRFEELDTGIVYTFDAEANDGAGAWVEAPTTGGGVQSVERLPDPRNGQIVYVEADYQAPYVEADFNLDFRTALITAQGGTTGFATAAAAAAFPGIGAAGGSLDGSAAGVLFLINDQGYPNLLTTTAMADELGASVVLNILTHNNVARNRRYPLPRYIAVHQGQLFRHGPGDPADLLDEEDRFGAGRHLVIRLEGASGKWLLPNGQFAIPGDTAHPDGERIEKGYYGCIDGEWVFFGATADQVRRLPALVPDGRIVFVVADYQNSAGETVRAGYYFGHGGEWLDRIQESDGVSAAVYLETDAGENGLDIGLRVEGSGANWSFRGAQRALAVRPTVRIQNPAVQAVPHLTVTIPDNLALPEDGNNWSVVVLRADNGAVNIDINTRQVNIFVPPAGVTLTALRNGLLAARYSIRAGRPDTGLQGGLGAANVVLTGAGATVYQAPAPGARVDINFAGGVNEEPIEDEADADADPPTYTVKYDAADTITQIAAAINAGDLAEATKVASAAAGANPEAVGFSRDFEGRRGVPGRSADYSGLSMEADDKSFVVRHNGAVVARMPEAQVKALLTNLGVRYVG